MPIDFSNTEGVTKGAQLALQAFGIKDRKQQREWTRKMQEANLSRLDRQEVRQVMAAEMANKISTVTLNNMKAEAERAKAEETRRQTKEARDAQEGIRKQAEFNEKQKALIRNNTLADKFSKGINGDVGFKGTLLDRWNPMGEAYLRSGEHDQFRKLAKDIGAMGDVQKPAAPKALELKMDAIRKAHPNLDLQTITGLATGTIITKTDPITGATSLVDMVKGTRKILDDAMIPGFVQKDDKGKITTLPPGKTVWGYSNIGTGPWSAFLAGGSVVSGWFGGPVAKETIKARQTIIAAQKDLVRSLQNNPRFSEGERKSIEREIDLKPGIFDNPQVFQERAKAIDRILRIRLENEIAAAKDTSLSPLARKAAGTTAKNIRNYLKLLGVPPTFSTPNDPGFAELPSGSIFLDSNGRQRRKQ